MYSPIDPRNKIKMRQEALAKQQMPPPVMRELEEAEVPPNDLSTQDVDGMTQTKTGAGPATGPNLADFPDHVLKAEFMRRSGKGRPTGTVNIPVEGAAAP